MMIFFPFRQYNKWWYRLKAMVFGPFDTVDDAKQSFHKRVNSCPRHI